MSNLPTNWDSYYQTPYRFSWLTRYFTNRFLLSAINRNLLSSQPINIVELGGGGSAFYLWLKRQLNVQKYIVVDNNQAGLDKLVNVAGLTLINHDITQPALTEATRGDVVFSVGLIEHFSADMTERAIEAHFDWATPNGLVVITYPTPTWLYRLSRKVSERMGWWIFSDETPIRLECVEQLLQPYGQVLEHRINWLTPFTQAIVVARKYH